MDDLISGKKAIRERILKERVELCKAEREEKSAAICASLESIREYANARSILFYMPIGGEADITPLIRKALKSGRVCALPKCASNRSLRMYTISCLESDVSPGAMEIPEPEGDAACECFPDDLSVLIMPGVAYDRLGHRLGRGAGYYDRLFAGGGRTTLRIAPAYAFQVLPELPHEPHDAPVDIIVTEEEIIDCRKGRGEYHG